MDRLRDNMTSKWVPILTDLAPDAGAYMSEVRTSSFRILDSSAPANAVKANPQQANWQQAFYSSNYDALLKIKQKYDPLGTFYAPTAVGSDSYIIAENGALCQAGPKPFTAI